MKKDKFSDTNFGKMMKGKGFYVALSLCLVAIGAAGILSYNRAMKELEGLSESPFVDPNQIQTDDVGKEQENVPKETQTGKQDEIKDAEPTEKNVEDKTLEKEVAYTMPLVGEIINPFSYGELVKSNTTNIWQTHNGADIKAELSSEVKAISQGEVIEVKQDTLWGNYVLIEHKNGITSKYCGLNSVIPVEKGDIVATGEVIGKLGEIPSEIADEPHLHLEVKQNGKFVNPIDIINPNSK